MAKSRGKCHDGGDDPLAPRPVDPDLILGWSVQVRDVFSLKAGTNQLTSIDYIVQDDWYKIN